MTPAIADPPSATKDRFSVALQHIAKIRPRVPTDTWTDSDAAAWWLKDHDPSSPTALPSSLILCVAARLFARYYWQFPLLTGLWSSMRQYGHWLETGFTRAGEFTYNLSHFCGVVHIASHPTEVGNATGTLQTGLQHFSHDWVGYCGRKTCTHRHSWFRGCLPEPMYRQLTASNLLRPWSSVNWGGLALVLPPLRHSIVTPYLSIRKERSHIAKTVVPYYVADSLNNLHQIVPALLSASSFQSYARPLLEAHCDALSSQRMRYSAIVALHSDAAKAMRVWDMNFTAYGWGLGYSDDNSRVYATTLAEDWDVDYQTQRKLAENEPTELFPRLPNDSSI